MTGRTSPDGIKNAATKGVWPGSLSRTEYEKHHLRLMREPPGAESMGAVSVSTHEMEAPMKTKAAILWDLHEKWQVEEVELDPPKSGEVLVKLTASGLCHSDYHLVTGDIPVPLPFVGGHEGAGVVA